MQNQELDRWEGIFSAWLRANTEQEDGSHDLSHFQRVWKTARRIDREEGAGADLLVLLTAAYFHDLVSLPKNHPDRKQSSRMSAEQVSQLLKDQFTGFPAEKIPAVYHAIHAHSFSAGIRPETVEAKILQDADRLEAVGAIGLARVFYTAGQLNQRLFHPEDPLAGERELDDQRYSLDHFAVKLLKLPALMNTATGRKIADAHAAYLQDFLHRISAEIAGDWE